MSLGLILTELVINALKHAFPDNRKGEIVVDYRSHGTGWALSVRDNGYWHVRAKWRCQGWPGHQHRSGARQAIAGANQCHRCKTWHRGLNNPYAICRRGKWRKNHYAGQGGLTPTFLKAIGQNVLRVHVNRGPMSEWPGMCLCAVATPAA